MSQKLRLAKEQSQKMNIKSILNKSNLSPEEDNKIEDAIDNMVDKLNKHNRDK